LQESDAWVISETLLLVLIVRETGLRSTLVAKLSMAGADVLTTGDFDDPRLMRHALRRLVLIADEAAVDGYDGGCDRLLAEGCWFRLVMLSPGAGAVSGDLRLIRLERTIAAATIVSLLPGWQTSP
jgi:hypothetical protein